MVIILIICFSYTTYEYKLIVRNEVGYGSSEQVVATTLAGFPKKGSDVMAHPLNNTAIEVEWTIPSKCPSYVNHQSRITVVHMHSYLT